MEKPSRFTATPQQILAYLKQEFCLDRVEFFLWAVGDAAVDEAAQDIETDVARHYPMGGPEEFGALAGAEHIRANKHYPVKALPFEKKD
jgi:hypothetical protein